MMAGNDMVLVQSNLDPDLFSDFERVKAHHGIARNSEVIRILIRKEARRVSQYIPAIYDILVAYHAGQITAEEAVSAIGGHRDTL